MRRAAKVDDNHRAIVEVLQSVPGTTVVSLAGVGNGCPDLLVGRRGETYLLELKDGDKSPSHWQLNALQKIWHGRWRGKPARVVKNVDEALAAIGVRRTPSNEDKETNKG